MEGLTAARYQLEAAEKELLMATNSMAYLADTLENMMFAQLKNAASVLHVLMDKLGKTGDRLVKVKGFLEAVQDD